MFTSNTSWISLKSNIIAVTLWSALTFIKVIFKNSPHLLFSRILSRIWHEVNSKVVCAVEFVSFVFENCYDSCLFEVVRVFVMLAVTAKERMNSMCRVRPLFYMFSSRMLWILATSLVFSCSIYFEMSCDLGTVSSYNFIGYCLMHSTAIFKTMLLMVKTC